jgi:hypothetical protein
MQTRVLALFVAAGLVSGAGLAAQEPDTGPVMRVFLKDGQGLPSFGESALIDDRLVFTLVIGDAGGTPQLQLVSLPLGLIDVERTSKYGEAVRAARYASTRGETDYAAMTRDISQALEELSKATDPFRRLNIAENARKRLLDWSKDSYGYRAADVQELTNLFDQVIAELRAAAGESKFSVDLSMGPAAIVHEPLMKSPTMRESMQLAMSAASATDDALGREAILGAVVKASADSSGVDDLRDEAATRLAKEQLTDTAYKALSTDVLSRADAAAAKGDVKAVLALKQTVAARDTALGASRSGDVEGLLKTLDAKLDVARSKRLTLDHYAMMRPQMLAYELKVRPALSALDGLKPIFEAIRDMTGPGFEWVMRADGRLKTLVPLMQAVEAPSDLSDVHATLTSAVAMAAQACERRKLAVAANDMPLAREASAAAAGALMLAAQARQELLARLYPPKN